MAEERTVRREVHERQTTVDGGVVDTVEAVETVAVVPGAPAREVRRVTTEVVETVDQAPAPVAPASGSTNVNVSKQASPTGNVSINTPDGTQVNING